VSRKRRVRLRALADLVSETFPDAEPVAVIADGSVLVNGYPVRNPTALVPVDASLRLRPGEPLRGEAKLSAALEAFAVPVRGRLAVDLGAAAGGFTRVLVDAGARCVYAVDAGHGQLLGSLRQSRTVVNLERTNLAELNRSRVPETVDLLTADLSYLPLARALPQLDLSFAADADLIAVVKPQFELGLGRAPDADARDLLLEAGRRAIRGAARAGWMKPQAIESPVTGARGAVELLLHGSRS
jgi:23S rRNA (cytidine1920-2'-O)/16S rRNA (cytidine1409-2'-O)-methyltransferase